MRRLLRGLRGGISRGLTYATYLRDLLPPPIEMQENPENGALLAEAREQIEAYAQEGGWGDRAAFERTYGVTWEDYGGKWFLVIGRRMYTAERDTGGRDL